MTFSDSTSDVINLLDKLLLDEYLQRDVYETYSHYIFGLCSISLQKHLVDHRNEEDKHITTLQRYLMSLRAEPLVKRLEIPVIEPPITNILLLDFELEKSAVKNYSEAVAALEEIGDSQFTALRVDLENILVQEQEHTHDLMQWLRTEVSSNEGDAKGKIC